MLFKWFRYNFMNFMVFSILFNLSVLFQVKEDHKKGSRVTAYNRAQVLPNCIAELTSSKEVIWKSNSVGRWHK